MGAGRLKSISETGVVELWERAAQNGRRLFTVDRVPVRIVYPGRTSDQPGADFQDAVVEIGGRVAKGNIEVHVRSQDWRTHGHHRDAAYNGVVLHVVMWHDNQPFTALENGCAIPVVALGNQPDSNTSQRRARAPPLSCTVTEGYETILAAVDRAGDARFGEKAAAFAAELGRTDAGQCLYRGIMKALGYSRNQSPFQTVAERLPLALLEEVARAATGTEELTGLEALLLGTAGFLPSQRPGITEESRPWMDAMESQWHLHSRAGMPGDLGWRFFRVRPGNHPVRRLAGMARLLLRFRESGLLHGLISELGDSHGVVGLALAVTVTADGYWADHFDFGVVCRGLDRFLIGPSRTMEIVVNAILPFAAARAQVISCPELGARAVALYQEYPTASENAIERHMRAQLGLKRSMVNTARRQQGLLHLYKRYCTQGRCGECKLGGRRYGAETSVRK